MDKYVIERLRSQIQQGQVILFTGAGFSLGARSTGGLPLPTTAGLADVLWDTAFANESRDESSLGDVYEAGLRTARRATEGVIRDRLTVDPRSLNDTYRCWFSFPWYCIYTVNIDSLADAANRAFKLPRPLREYSALTDSTPSPIASDLPVVHLNGRLCDLPKITFSMRQYGERLGRADPWYEMLVRDLRLRPVIYVGTSLDEPPLWTYVEARGERPAERERRPGSYLVTPKLALARRVALAGYNITWVEASAEEFATQILEPMTAAAEEGQRAVGHRIDADHGGRILLPVLDIIDDSVNDEREFLHGREPRWSDITHGYAFERQCDVELARRLFRESPNLVVITGTAGSGKSTSGMRLILDAAARGKRALVLNPMTNAGLHEICAAVQVSGVEVLFIDDIARFGPAMRGFLADLISDNRGLCVVTCIRAGRLEREGSLVPRGYDEIELAIPHLQSSDVDALLDSLTRANRLGGLEGRSHAERKREVKLRFNSQLLVAMIEITHDARFGEKVDSECRELTGDASDVYAAAALATSLRTPLRDDELVMASGAENPANAMLAIDRLLGRHLLIRTSDARVAVRHPVIAETAVRFFGESGALLQTVTNLAYALAASARPGDLGATPSGRLLKRVLNHDYLIRLLYRRIDDEVDKAAVRGVYDRVEGVLKGDHHYWLQRGSFETESGNLDYAKMFLRQARRLAPHDRFVRTEWSYMSLKRASRAPSDPRSAEDVQRAFAELEDVISQRGRQDSFPFHVYGSQGLAWARRGPISDDQRKQLLERLRAIVAKGLEWHPKNVDLASLKKALDREYMMMAVAPPERPADAADPGNEGRHGTPGDPGEAPA
jgi:hypothetical protein